MKLNSCGKFHHVTSSQCHCMKIIKDGKKSKFARNFWYERVKKFPKPAIVSNNFPMAFKIWKLNAKFCFDSKVIDIRENNTFFAMFSIFNIIFYFPNDVIKEWEPFCNFLPPFCLSYVKL